MLANSQKGTSCNGGAGACSYGMQELACRGFSQSLEKRNNASWIVGCYNLQMTSWL